MATNTPWTKTIQHNMETNPIVTLAGSIILQIIAGLGLFKWSRSEWLTFGGPFPHGWEGYTLFDWFGIAAFLFCGPLGFCLAFTALQQLIRNAASQVNQTQRVVLAVVAITYFVALSAFGWFWGWDILKCGVIGCVNSSFHIWEGTHNAKPEAGIGFKVTIGIPMVITTTALIIVTLLSLWEHQRNAAYHASHAQVVTDTSTKHTSFTEPLLVQNSLEDSPLQKNPMLKRYSPYNTHMLGSTATAERPVMPDSTDHGKIYQARSKIWIWFAIYTVFLILWWFFAGYVPNNWEYYYPARIAEKAQISVTNDGDLCAKQWQKYTCPETPGAFMSTHGLRFNQYFELKLFPSNQIFYLFLFIWTLIAVSAKQISEPITRFFGTKIRVAVPYLPFTTRPHKRDRLAFFTYAEFGSFFLLCGAVYLFFHYWFWDHNYVGYWPDKDGGYNIALSERFARTLGQIAVFFFALLMFPAARNSPLLAMVGISWEASIQYHRWLGAAFFVMTLGHMLCAYWWYYVSGDLKDIYQIPQTLPTSVDNFTVPLIQYCVWFSIISIGVMSLAWQQFRRQHFDVWMFFHHFTYLTMIPAVLWHAQASWEYILPATTIWFFDRLVRAFRSVRAVNLVTAVQASAASGEKYHTINPFSPNSVDARILTPAPIKSIHDHKNYQQERVFFQPIDSNSNSTDLNNSDPDNNNTNTNTNTTRTQIQLSSSFVHSTSSLTNLSLNGQDPLSPPERIDEDSPSSSSSSTTTATSTTARPHQLGLSSTINVSGPGVRVVDRGEAGTYIELRIINDNMVFFPGHYAFLNIAEISLFEWHPFTIASPAHFNARSEIMFVIKTMGVNTWTQSLYNYVVDYQRSVGATSLDFVDVPLTVSLDGPYGTPIDFSTYDIVILLGGGIGITPCKSIYESLLLSYLHDFKSRLMYQHTQQSLGGSGGRADATGDYAGALSEPTTNPILMNLNVESVPLVATNKRVHLMWSSRDPMLFELMSESLAQAPYGPFSAQLYCDNPNMSPEQDQHLLDSEKRILDPNIVSLIRSGRPNLELEFKTVVDEFNPNSYLSGSHSGDSTLSKSPKLSVAGRSTGPVDPTSNQHGGTPEGQAKRVLVFVCGPGPMAKDAEIICQENGWDFHTETFAL